MDLFEYMSYIRIETSLLKVISVKLILSTGIGIIIIQIPIPAWYGYLGSIVIGISISMRFAWYRYEYMYEILYRYATIVKTPTQPQLNSS